jgi:rhodanese-related sulfurtransferase
MNAVPTAAVDGVPDPVPEGLVVLDVREDDEWQAGHLDGSIHIPLQQLGERWSELPSGQTLVVCRSGHRSASATAYLVAQDVDAINLHGGLMAWETAGRPLVTDDGAPGMVL